jgi:hypothetical protein
LTFEEVKNLPRILFSHFRSATILPSKQVFNAHRGAREGKRGCGVINLVEQRNDVLFGGQKGFKKMVFVALEA